MSEVEADIQKLDEINNIAEFVNANEKEQWEFISMYLMLFLGKKIKDHKEEKTKLDFIELTVIDRLQTGLWFYVHLNEGEDTRKAYINANKRG